MNDLISCKLYKTLLELWTLVECSPPTTDVNIERAEGFHLQAHPGIDSSRDFNCIKTRGTFGKRAP